MSTSAMMFIKYLFALLILGISFSTFAKEDKYNLAFDEAFVGYLSDRLALQLARKERLEPQPNLSKEDAGFRAAHFRDVRMAYRAKLISCDGPLEELAKYLGYSDFDLGESRQGTGLLVFVGSNEHLIWPNRKLEYKS
jgi:hypothetical protein